MRPVRVFLSVGVVAVILLVGVTVFGATAYEAIADSGEIAGGQMGGGDGSANVQQAQRAFPGLLNAALSPENVRRYVEVANNASAGPASHGALINFDDVAAPCPFEDTAALRGLHQGGFFWAPRSDGGAILDECSNFGVPAHSPPNFLAFNNAVVYPDGGVPKLPELIMVGPGHTRVSMWASGGYIPGFPVAIIAFGPGGVQDVQVFVTMSTWVEYGLTGTDIRGLLLIGNPQLLVIDDIVTN